MLGMDALVTECSWNTNVLWFGNGCSGHRMLGMDALVTECSWNTNVLWFGNGCSGHRMLLEHKRVKCGKTWDGKPCASSYMF